MSQATAKFLGVNSPSRYIVMSDVHGRREAFETMLCDHFNYDIVRGILVAPDAHTHLIVNGDIIDRGEDSPGMVRHVRRMVSDGIATMYRGNHENDTLHIHDLIEFEKNKTLRLSFQKKAEKKTYYRQYLDEYGVHGREQAYDDIAWFRTLPYFGDYGSFRVAHASYDAKNIALLAAVDAMDKPDLARITMMQIGLGVTLEQAVSETLHGTVFHLGDLKNLYPDIPDTRLSYRDPHGTMRDNVRVKTWSENSASISRLSDVLIVPDDYLHDYVAQCPDTLRGFGENFVRATDADKRPLFLGHYNLDEKPAVQNERVAVLDFRHHLTAYVHEPAQTRLSNANLVTFPA